MKLKKELNNLSKVTQLEKKMNSEFISAQICVTFSTLSVWYIVVLKY